MDDDAPPADEGKSGSPAWMATFADLMSLLMCFFVLLLSFSEMDVLKFKQLAGSMREAFGVQREIKVKETSKGTSIVAQEFSPGRPEPSAIIDLRQMTTDEAKENLDFGDVKESEKKKEKEDNLDELKEALQEQIKKMIAQQIKKLKSLLKKDVEIGLIEMESENDQIVIRIREKGSFPLGGAQLNRSFYPILNKIGSVLKEVEGEIIVSGHTDNIPIYTTQYPSNWVLSAARAASVVHHLTKYPKVPDSRIEIRAFGDSKPIDTNKTPAGRGKNRRVEISIRYGGIESIVSEDLRAALMAGSEGKLEDITKNKKDKAEKIKSTNKVDEEDETPQIRSSATEYAGGDYKLVNNIFGGPVENVKPTKKAPSGPKIDSEFSNNVEQDINMQTPSLENIFSLDLIQGLKKPIQLNPKKTEAQ